MRNHLAILTLALPWFWHVSDAAPKAIQQYAIETIDYPGFQGTTVAAAINDAGRIVGAFSVPGTQDSYGFSYWHGAFALLPSAACQTAHCEMNPLAINSRGDIAGEFSDSIDHRAVFIIRDGTLQQLISIPRSADLAILGGLNEHGDVVGYFQADTGKICMFLYRDAVLSEPAIPADFVDVVATGINNRGQIAGSYDDARGLHGFIEKNGLFNRIDVPGAVETRVAAINETGDVVGSYAVREATEAIVQHGFLLSHGTLVTIDVPGGTNTLPSVLADDGTVAGTFENPAGMAPFNTEGFVFSKGTYSHLNVPGSVQGVSGISRSGEVVGAYFDSNCPTDCSIHGFIATAQHKGH